MGATPAMSLLLRYKGSVRAHVGELCYSEYEDQFLSCPPTGECPAQHELGCSSEPHPQLSAAHAPRSPSTPRAIWAQFGQCPPQLQYVTLLLPCKGPQAELLRHLHLHADPRARRQCIAGNGTDQGLAAYSPWSHLIWPVDIGLWWCKAMGFLAAVACPCRLAPTHLPTPDLNWVNPAHSLKRLPTADIDGLLGVGSL